MHTSAIVIDRQRADLKNAWKVLTAELPQQYTCNLN